MRLQAVLSERGIKVDRRRFGRRSLKLPAVISSSAGKDLRIVIRDISAGGVLIEGDTKKLSVGEQVSIRMPSGAVNAKVAWLGAQFLGCEFERVASRDVLSAAMLASDHQHRTDGWDPYWNDARPVVHTKRVNAKPQRKLRWVGFALAGALWGVIILIGNIMAG